MTLGRERGSPTCIRAWRPPIPPWCSSPMHPAPPTDSTSCSAGCPTARPKHSMPELRTLVKHVVDLAADFRLSDPAVYAQWYGEEHQAPDLLADFVYGLPELHRDSIARRKPRGRARLLSHCGHLGARAVAPRRHRRDAGHHRRRRQRGLRRRAGTSTRSAGRTRTSSRTDCSTTVTRRRSNRASMRRCSSRRISRR